MEALGGFIIFIYYFLFCIPILNLENYRPADPWSERFMYDNRSLEEIMEEEENWE